MVSDRIQPLQESLTIAIATQAKEMKAMGEDILSFSAGEPDFDTPNVIKNAAIKAIENGCGSYTPIQGIPEVINAILTKLRNDNNLIYDKNDIVTNVGAKHSLFNVLQTIINKDDEVIIPAPYWVSYPEIVKFCEGKPVFVETNEETEYKITNEQLKNAITNKTKAIILNTPSNPTGSIYTKEELLSLSEVLKDTEVLIISDEIYEKIIFCEKFISVASINDDMYKRTITINGLSKSAAMPGWRFGYLACPNKEITKSIIKLQSQSTSNITSIVQYAAIPALLGEANRDIEKMRMVFEERRNIAVDLINEIPNLSVLNPEGAFYLFINISKFQMDSMKFCKDLLQEKKVAVVPGIGFGSEGHVRFSFSTDLASIKNGIKRISEFVTKK